MWPLASPMWKTTIGVVFLSVFAVVAEGAEVAHVKWEDLSMVTGHTVRVFLPEGAIKGKAGRVEIDALIVRVEKSTNRIAYPKGIIRISRQNLHRLEMQIKGKAYRIALTSLGGALGVVLGIGAAYFGVERCDLLGHCRNDRPAAAAGAAIGITAAGLVGGYYAGNSADKHWTTIEILE